MTYPVTIKLSLISVLLASASPAAVAQTAVEVPGVVIESATLDKPKVAAPRKATVAASAAPVADDAAVKPKRTQQTSTGKAKETAADADAAPAQTAGSNAASGAAAANGVNANGGDAGGVANGVAAEQVGSAVSVITAADIKARQIQYAADALRSLPGVSVTRSGGFGSLTEVRLRGAETRHTLVLIDGIDASESTNGTFDFANLAADDIERIEVLRGGQSGVGGSKAIGGVVSITTKGGKGPLSVAASAEGGSFGTRSVSGRVSGGNDQFWMALSASHLATDGFAIAPNGHMTDPSQITTVGLKGGATLLAGLSLDFSLRHSQKENDYDDIGIPAGGTYYEAIDSQPYNRTGIWMGGAKLTWETLGGALTHVFTGQFNRTNAFDDHRDFSSPSNNLSEREHYGYAATVRLGSPDTIKHSITGSIQKEIEDFTPTASYSDGITRHRENVAAIGEYRAEILNQFFPTVSVRHDQNDTFSDYTTWHAALSVPLRQLGIRPHASVGTAVTLPTMFSQFGYVLSSYRPNPDLKPEQSFGYDAGAELTLLSGRASVDVTYFKADLTDKIKSVYLPPSYIGTSVNDPGQSTREGVEVAGRWLATDALSFGAAYTFLNARDPGGAQEIRRPEHAARFDVNLAFDKGRGNLNVAAVYNGQSRDDAFNAFFQATRLTLDDYWLVNAAASYRVANGVEVFGRVENLLDQKYQEAYGYAAPGVAAYAGLRFKMDAGGKP